jgi:hypothetical protein
MAKAYLSLYEKVAAGRTLNSAIPVTKVGAEEI